MLQRLLTRSKTSVFAARPTFTTPSINFSTTFSPLNNHHAIISKRTISATTITRTTTTQQQVRYFHNNLNQITLFPLKKSKLSKDFSFFLQTITSFQSTQRYTPFITRGTGTTPFLFAATGVLPTPEQNNNNDNIGGGSSNMSEELQRPPRRRGSNRNSPETDQDDVFHPQGRPPNPIPALAWEIRRDLTKPEYKKVLQTAMGANWTTKGQPKWDETDPIGSVEDLIARIVHDMHRVSICIAPIAQNLSLVNSMGQMYNREKKRGIIPVFDLDRLASFQRRLVNRYKKVIELIPHDGEELDKDTAQQRFASLQGALQLCLYDVSLMYAIDSAIAQHHPRHPKSFLQQSIKAQADYFMQRRNLIAKQLRAEQPEISDDDFKKEFNKRITVDTQLMNEMLEQRRVDEQKRWAQMQRAQILRARQRRHQQLQEQKKLATGNEQEDDEETLRDLERND